MRKVEALKILRMHNDYRRGAIEMTHIQAAEITPHKIGEAIDTAIEMMELQIELGGQKETVHKARK